MQVLFPHGWQSDIPGWCRDQLSRAPNPDARPDRSDTSHVHAGVPHQEGAQEDPKAKPSRGLEGGAGKDPTGSGACARAQAAYHQSDARAGHRSCAGPDQDRGARPRADGQAAEAARGLQRFEKTHSRREEAKKDQEDQGGHLAWCTRCCFQVYQIYAAIRNDEFIAFPSHRNLVVLISITKPVLLTDFVCFL